MRLYVNTKEVPLLKSALQLAIGLSDTPIGADRLSDLLERVILCEELQDNMKRSHGTNE